MKGSHDFLKEEIEKQIAVILGAMTKKEIEQSWNKFKGFLKKQKYKDRSIVSIISKVRQGAKDSLKPNVFKLHKKRLQWCFEVCTNDAIVLEKVKKEDIKAFRKKRNDRNNVINNFNEMLNKAISLLDSYNYLDITNGLALLTGRRTIEILKTGVFTYIDKDHVKFDGQAKKRGKKAKAYIIPILAGGAKLVIDSIELLRKLKDFSGVENEGVHNIASSGLNRVVKKEFSEFCPRKLNVHDLRKIYASYCMEHLRGNDKYITERNRRYFLSELLGHGDGDGDAMSVSSGERYEDFDIHL